MNLTYILGAGASANALPIVKNMHERIEIFIEHFRKFIHLTGDEENQLKTLSTEIKKHYTIDTYAKKLFLKGRHAESELFKLYNFMGAFFIYEQLKKDRGNDISEYLFKQSDLYRDDERVRRPYDSIINHLDYRYDSFYAALLKSDREGNSYLPDHINVISWNYDFQLEVSFMNFMDGLSLDEIQDRLNVYPTPSEKELRATSAIIKINGTAGFWKEEKKYKELFDFRDHILNKDSMDILKNILFQKSESYKSSIYFAWNDDAITNKARKYATEIIAKTDILVVIGYSFPYFNRDVDRDIFSLMGNTKVVKIYVQTTDDTLLSIINRAKGVNESFEHAEGFIELDQFLIPNEL